MKFNIKNILEEYKLFVANGEKNAVILDIYKKCKSVCADKFLTSELEICTEFLDGKISVSEARKHAFACHRYARSLSEPQEIALARACGHAIATIHVKEHAMASYGYYLKYKTL